MSEQTVHEAITCESVQAWRSFLEAHARVTDELERELQETQGLPLAFYDVLAQLARAPEGRLRMQDLAQRLLLSRSGFTRLSDRMEAAGLLQRSRCPSDRRGVYAEITPAGRAALDAAAPVHMRGVQEHFARYLGTDDLQVLRGLLDRVCEGNRTQGAVPGAGRDVETPPG
ncbi:MAG: MarR family winged helix-turn-helix transcriptional regulator [Actinomycetota bacterium]